MSSSSSSKIVSWQRVGPSFYGEYNGHLVEHLDIVYNRCAFESEKRKPVIWLAGDSSLDCKYWSLEAPRFDATNGYEDVLDPPRCVGDICYFMNADERAKEFGHVCINTAVEATTLEGRLRLNESQNADAGALDEEFEPLVHGQDRFLRDHMTEDDVLVISVGGNDIALAPTLSTILSMGALMYLAPEFMVRNGWALGYGHFKRMFGETLRQYIELLVARTKPRLVVLCMIYFPDEEATGSWADQLFHKIGYDTNPGKLQAAIEHIYESTTCTVQCDGINISPFPLFRVLDGKNTEDYVSRVEPSVQGARKMSNGLLGHIYSQ